MGGGGGLLIRKVKAKHYGKQRETKNALSLRNEEGKF